MRKECLKKFRLVTIWTWTSAILVQHSNQLRCSKASLHLHQIKSLRSCHFLLNLFCYYFILLTFFLFISFFFRPCWKNKWVSPACSKRFGQKRTKNVHSWWNVLSCKGSVLSRGKKTQAAIISISAQVFIQECSHNLQHIVRWPGHNWTVCLLQQCHFSNTCTGIEKNYSQKILMPLTLHWMTLQVVVGTIKIMLELLKL